MSNTVKAGPNGGTLTGSTTENTIFDFVGDDNSAAFYEIDNFHVGGGRGGETDQGTACATGGTLRR